MRSRCPTDPAPRRFLAIRSGLLLAMLACGGAGSGPPRRVVIPMGSSFAAAAESLSSAGLIGSPKLFAAYAKLRGHDRGLKAGTYMLPHGASWSRLIDALSRGRGLVPGLTVVEGWSLQNVVPQLARALAVPVESVEAAVADSALRHRLDIPTPTVEGYLFPDTYTFAPGTPARDAVASMVAAFERHWDPAWDARLEELAMSRHDIVTLASIIEREAMRPEERPVISAVYHNRLKKGMRLQADPTVQYALGRHVARVLYSDLEVDSPYNTYRHAGLPPGPIGSPGLPSIRAALFPADVPYLFFVAHPDGHHEFRTTFREHADAVRDMRRIRDSLARARGAAPAQGR